MAPIAELASTKTILLTSTAALTFLVTRCLSTTLVSKSGFLAALCIFVFELFTIFVYHIIIYPSYLSPFRKLPSPPNAKFFLGHTFEMLKELNVGANYRSWAEIPSDGVLRILDLFNVERLLITSPAAFAEVLVHKCYDYEKPEQFRKTGKRILGDGILFAEGDVHKGQRKAFMSAFSFRHIKDLYPLFWKKSTTLVRKLDLQEMKDGTITVEVNAWASKAALDIIGEAALGLDIQTIEDPDNQLSITYRGLFAPGKAAHVLAISSLFLPPWLVYNLPVYYNRIAKANAAIINKTCRQQISTFRNLKSSNRDLPANIITAAMASGNFTDEEIVQQMTTFLVAGHETTATALTWTMQLLCKYPEVQTRLRAELHASNLPSPRSCSSTIIAPQIDTLPYLNAVCAEALRLYPPVPATVRQAHRDTTIGDLAIPKGTLMMLAPWVVNTSTALWGTTAGSFDPERWIQAPDGGAKSNYANLTFLHGPRSCIGERFARAEMACLLAAWVGAFEIEAEGEMERGEEVTPVDMAVEITAKPKGGVWVKLRPVGIE